MNKIISCATILPLALASASAFAASVDYTLTSGTDTITFSLPKQPTAAACAFDGSCATFNGVAVNVDGTLYPNAQVNFYLSSNDGGLTIFTDATDATMLVDNDGNGAEQLFSGTVTAPALIAPVTSYVLHQEGYGNPKYNEQFNLTAALVPDLVVTTSQDDAGTASNCTEQAAPGIGTDAACSLRDALLEAVNLGSANISFDATAFSAGNTVAQNTINLNATLPVSPSTTIIGPTTGSGATLTNLVTLSGGGPTSNFSALMATGTGSKLSNLNITNGYLTNGLGGLNTNYGAVITLQGCTVFGNGGAFFVDYGASVILIQSTVFGNTGGIAYVEGGGTMNIFASTLSGNTGGDITNDGGTITVADSTFSGNHTAQYGEGGGIRNDRGTLTVTRSTFSGNNADYLGGGIFNGDTATISNSIVAGNSSNYQYADMYGGYTDGGGNLIGTNVSNTSEVVPGLAPLANYGGTMYTQLPQPGSAAICAGLSSNVPGSVITDQRGLPRTNLTYPGYSTSSLCVDSGAVQTNYKLNFTTEPPAYQRVNHAMAPAPVVTLTENDMAALSASGSIAVTDSAALLKGTTKKSLASGAAAFTNLVLPSDTSNDTLTATLALNHTLNLIAQSTAFQAVTPQPSTLTSPTPGSTLTSSIAVFTWTPIAGATGYTLWLGSTGVGSSDLFGKNTTVDTLTAQNLPANAETIYARLWTYFNGATVYTDATFTAVSPATLRSPTPGATFGGSSQTFTWPSLVGATGYTLWLGSTGAGSYNLFGRNTTATTVTAQNLPANGETIYARLWTDFNNVSAFNDYTFTAVSPAMLISPTPSATLTGSSQTFTWASLAGAADYSLWLGSTGVGSHNLFGKNTTATALTVPHLPVNGETIYVRLWTDFNDVSAYTDYTFTAK